MKYKIKNHIIDAKSPVEALKIHKLVDSCKVKDATPITVENVPYKNDKYVVLEFTHNNDKRYFVVAKENYHNEKRYTGGGILEYDLSSAKKTADDFLKMNGKSYKEWMNNNDSLKDSKIIKLEELKEGDTFKDPYDDNKEYIVEKINWLEGDYDVKSIQSGIKRTYRGNTRVLIDSIKDDDSNMIPSEIILKLMREGKWDDRTKAKYVGKVTINGKEQDKFIYGIPGGKTQFALYIKEGKFQGIAQQGSNINLPDSDDYSYAVIRKQIGNENFTKDLLLKKAYNGLTRGSMSKEEYNKLVEEIKSMKDSSCKDVAYTELKRYFYDLIDKYGGYYYRTYDKIFRDLHNKYPDAEQGDLDYLISYDDNPKTTWKYICKYYTSFDKHVYDSVKDDDIDELSAEEEQAIADYKKAIMNTNDVKLLKLFAHILKEETEHLEELQNEEIEDSKLKKK